MKHMNIRSTNFGCFPIRSSVAQQMTVDGWMDGRMDRWMGWFVFVFVIFVALGKRCCVRVKKMGASNHQSLYFSAVEI